MTTRVAPPWLAAFQARFSDVIRTPLDRASGTLLATPWAYGASVVRDALDGPAARGDDRLAVYNRQYWFRLFDVLQSAFPLTSRLVGPWMFNDYAARFLLLQPPRGWDIEQAADGFDAFVADELECDDLTTRQALIEAARIDSAWREVFRAPATRPFRPSAADAARLLDAHVVPSPARRLVEEHRPLLELRAHLLRDRGDARIELPPTLARSRSWALVRGVDGILQIPLAPREAELLRLLDQWSVRDALALLERACSPEERALLPAQARSWLARSVAQDFWSGIRFGD